MMVEESHLLADAIPTLVVYVISPKYIINKSERINLQDWRPQLTVGDGVARSSLVDVQGL